MTISQLRDQPEERVITLIEIPAYDFKLKKPSDEDEDDDGND